MAKNRQELLKELADKKIAYWELCDETPKLYEKKRIALSLYQQHIRDKTEIERRITEIRNIKDMKE